MQVVGYGVDVLDISSVNALLEDPNDDLVESAFTDLEQQLAPRTRSRATYYAGRLAAKEAVVKALGSGFSGDITWMDIEITERNKTLSINLTGRAQEVATALGVVEWHLSLAHCRSLVVASALAVGA